MIVASCLFWARPLFAYISDCNVELASAKFVDVFVVSNVKPGVNEPYPLNGRHSKEHFSQRVVPADAVVVVDLYVQQVVRRLRAQERKFLVPPRR